MAGSIAGGFLAIVPNEPFLSKSYSHLRGTHRNRAARSSVDLSESRPDILWTGQFEIIEPPFGLIRLPGGPSASLVMEAIFDHMNS
jgi:hypothetical protein